MIERKGLITMRGNALTLIGRAVQIGEQAPDAELMDQDLKPRLLSSYLGKNLLLLSVPSLDTSVCSLEAARFNKEVSQWGDGLTTFVISMDLPFAQKRWCGQEKASYIKTLSDYRTHEFGEKYGVYIKEIGLLARSVFLIDSQFKVRYVHLVEEVTKEPPYEEVIHQIKKVLSVGV